MDDLISAGFDKAEVKQKLTEEASNFEDYYYNPDNNTKQEPYKTTIVEKTCVKQQENI